MPKVRKGSGKMARMIKKSKTLSNRRAKAIASGTSFKDTVRRRHVKLDTKGLHNFGKILGRDGVIFQMGLFTKKAVEKGVLLEYGTRRQVARPWLSSVLAPNSDTRRRVLNNMAQLVRDATKGKNTRKTISKKLTKVIQEHLYQQKFEAAPLSDSTIRQKIAKGNSADADKIGLDTFQMASQLNVKSSGGRQNRSTK